MDSVDIHWIQIGLPVRSKPVPKTSKYKTSVVQRILQFEILQLDQHDVVAVYWADKVNGQAFQDWRALISVDGVFGWQRFAC